MSRVVSQPRVLARRPDNKQNQTTHETTQTENGTRHNANRHNATCLNADSTQRNTVNTSTNKKTQRNEQNTDQRNAEQINGCHRNKKGSGNGGNLQVRRRTYVVRSAVCKTLIYVKDRRSKDLRWGATAAEPRVIQ